MKWKGSSFCCMHICTNFRWPGPEGCSLTVPLGRCTFFPEWICLLFHMDLPSEFYNIHFHKTQKKYVAYSSPFTLHECNTMPHSVEEPCNLCAQNVIFSDEKQLALLSQRSHVFLNPVSSNLLNMERHFPHLQKQ